jgi:hypothetical protein
VSVSSMPKLMMRRGVIRMIAESSTSPEMFQLAVYPLGFRV